MVPELADHRLCLTSKITNMKKLSISDTATLIGGGIKLN
jgi:hypothetical protein